MPRSTARPIPWLVQTATYAFAKHDAPIVDIFVQTPERVLSVDAQRTALLWNGRTAGAVVVGDLGGTVTVLPPQS